MSVRERLREANGLSDLAEVLGYTPNGLAFILYKAPPGGRYQAFAIPKRSGGTRNILAPDERLKRLQRELCDVLKECQREIAEERGFADKFSHGFEEERSIITNAWHHKNRRFVLNLDLLDFFPSINFGRVRGFLIKNKHYAFQPKVATILAQIACHESKLPQGAPSSPIISNLIAHVLDVRMGRLAAAAKCTYTRYADDLTFSTNQKVFPVSIAYEMPGTTGVWALSEALAKRIADSGFAVNIAKTRMQCRQSQQTVTGLTVNDKVNVRASYYRAARAMCHSLFQTGEYYRGATSSQTLPPGRPPKRENGIPHIEGVMAHIYHVKRTSDVRSGRLDPKLHSKEAINAAKYASYRDTYKALLYYKHFVALERPLIVCEGKSDNIYLRSALLALDPNYPTLAEKVGEKLVTKVRFLRQSRVEHDILELNGGTGNLKNFIERYEKAVYRFKHRPLKHAVVVLVDNDSGSTPIFSVLKQRGITINLTSTALFYHVCFNLYLVKTPERLPSGTSAIEDLFDKTVRERKVDGRFLSVEKDFDLKHHFGKVEFAERIVRQQFSTINFDAFIPLLDRVAMAVADYKTLKP